MFPTDVSLLISLSMPKFTTAHMMQIVCAFTAISRRRRLEFLFEHGVDVRTDEAAPLAS